MNRRTRVAAGAALLMLLAGCSASAVDVPEEAEVTIAPAPTAARSADAVAPGPPPAADQTVPVPTLDADELDCAAVLPVETIEAVLEVPSGFITPVDAAGCAWSMAGNPSAVAVQAASGAGREVFDSQRAAGATEESELGDEAFFRPGDASVGSAATLVVLAGDRLVSVSSFVGGREALETLADAVLATEPDAG